MLNLDRSKRLVIETENMQWEDSPASGVMRKKLEREGVESGLTTSVVKYLAGTAFSEHSHPKGEEIFVLEGVFEDEHGKYPKGSYLRNPHGSFHSPKSTIGCDILVKLNQFDKQDDRQLNINTAEQVWQQGVIEGLEVKPLHSFGTEHVALVRWAAGTYFNRHVHPGGEEIFVIEGELEDEFGCYPKGTWLRNPSYSFHTPFSKNGCVIYVRTGYM